MNSSFRMEINKPDTDSDLREKRRELSIATKVLLLRVILLLNSKKKKKRFLSLKYKMLLQNLELGRCSVHANFYFNEVMSEKQRALLSHLFF